MQPAAPPASQQQQLKQQYQQKEGLETARLLAAAADAAAAQHFTRSASMHNCMPLQLPQWPQHNAVHMRLPSKPGQWMNWPNGDVIAGSTCTTIAAPQLAFHNHGSEISLSVKQDPALYMLPNGEHVTVVLSTNLGGGRHRWRPIGVGDGLSLVRVRGGRCTITVKPCIQGRDSAPEVVAAANRDPAAEAAAAAAAAAAPVPPGSSTGSRRTKSSNKSKEGTPSLLEVDVEINRVLVLRHTAEPQQALQQQQQQQQLLLTGSPGTQAAAQQQQHCQQQHCQQQQQQQQHDVADLYWRPITLSGVQYLLGCVCLNIFTGRELSRRHWPADQPLPVLVPVPRLLDQTTAQQQQQRQQQGEAALHSAQQVEAANAGLLATAATVAAAMASTMNGQQLPGLLTAPAAAAAGWEDEPAAAAAVGLGIAPPPSFPWSPVQHLEGCIGFEGLPDLSELLQEDQQNHSLQLWQGNPQHDLLAAAAAAAAAALGDTAAAAGHLPLAAADLGHAELTRQAELLTAAGPAAVLDDLLDDSSSEISLALSEECRQRDAAVDVSLRSLQDFINEQGTALSYQVLKLFAGMHGANSIERARLILHQDVPAHNWQARQHSARQVQLQDLREGWFLQRPLMHLAVSNVLDFGPDSSQQPQGLLPGEQRLYLLQWLLDDAVAAAAASSAAAAAVASPSEGRRIRSAAVRQLLQSTNRNQACVFFSACHFSIPEALQFLLGLPELGWRQMLQATKRGKLFYHIISTEAHRALQHANRALQDRNGALHEAHLQRYQQLRQGMYVTLRALADRFAGLEPAQVEAIKAKIMARLLQQQQQNMLAMVTLQPTAAAGAAEQLPMLQPNSPACTTALLLQTHHNAASIGSHALSQPSSSGPLLLYPQAGSCEAADLGLSAASSVAAGGTGGSAAPQAGSSTCSNSDSKLVGHKRQHSGSNCAGNGSRWPDDVLWILHHYCLFHTSWSSIRAPPYNGQLLEEVAAELFGFQVRSAV